MPEGPECTITAEGLNYYCANRTLTSVKVISGRYLKTPLANIDTLQDLKILAVKNKGKFIYWSLSSEIYLFSTLGMSGTYSTTKTPHTRVVFTLDKTLEVCYNDVRNFGTLKVANRLDLEKKLKEIGPDMLNGACSFPGFLKIIEKNKGKILGPFLLDQKKISGIGNIYKAEVCYEASVDPSRTLSSFSREELHRIYLSILKILTLAYKYGGSSQKDFQSVNGTLGTFLTDCANVYHRATDRLGNPVTSVSLGDGRTTWWCPNVQK